jgi:hypothetical protein
MVREKEMAVACDLLFTVVRMEEPALGAFDVAGLVRVEELLNFLLADLIELVSPRPFSAVCAADVRVVSKEDLSEGHMGGAVLMLTAVRLFVSGHQASSLM